MPMLNDRDRTALAEIFANQLHEPVAIDLFTQRAADLVVPGYECATCRETNALLEEVAGLAPQKITVRMHDFITEGEKARQAGVDRIPALIFRGKNQGTLRYFGVPAGYEFSVFVGGLVDVSRGTTELSAAARQQVAGLTAPVHVTVLVTPT